jgi:hypothetical protein
MSRHLLLIMVLSLVSAASAAETVVKKDEDGHVVERYKVDSEGRKEGPYTQYFPTGKVKVRATYREDQLEGAYTENDERGKKRLTAFYKAGKLDGLLTQYDKGRVALKQPFKDGQPVFSRDLKQIRKTILEIYKPELPEEKEAKMRELALRRLKLYRYLADLPYKNLVLDDDMNKAAEAGAKISARLKRLDHEPKNPGMPEAEYKLAYRGANHSNLAAGYRGDLVRAVDEWISDSDKYNRDRLGHRRWCLNPKLRRVGFGRSGVFMAMFAWDQSQPKVPDYDFISFPGRGPTPVELFKPNYVWHVVLNPSKFLKPGSSARARIYAVDERLNKVGEPLKLNYERVDPLPYAYIGGCIIFRPEKEAVAPGKRYLVEIDRVKRRSGAPALVRFVVEFVRLK